MKQFKREVIFVLQIKAKIDLSLLQLLIITLWFTYKIIMASELIVIPDFNKVWNITLFADA